MTDVQLITVEALKEIRGRSYSGRHPELGKMIKCQVCGLRHRQHERVCTQRIIKPTTPSKTTDEHPERANRHLVGAAATKGKRINKHPSKRQFQLIRLVRFLAANNPDMTPEDVADAKELAKEILGWNRKKMYGTYVKKPKPSSTDSSSEKEPETTVPSETS